MSSFSKSAKSVITHLSVYWKILLSALVWCVLHSNILLLFLWANSLFLSCLVVNTEILEREREKERKRENLKHHYYYKQWAYPKLFFCRVIYCHSLFQVTFSVLQIGLEWNARMITATKVNRILFADSMSCPHLKPSADSFLALTQNILIYFNRIKISLYHTNAPLIKLFKVA